MKKIFLTLLLTFILFFSSVSIVDARVSVKGYYRKSGTYVQPHYRTNPNGRTYDNWSAKGNYNPYSGKKGSVRW